MCYNIDMEAIYDILLRHAARYPLMRPCDAVKLIFQNEFGSGHMVKNEAAALERLLAELAQTKRDAAAPLYEDIGNGLVRLNLCAADAALLPPQSINAAFVATANTVRGVKASFFAKLDTLRTACAQGHFAFSTVELGQYIEQYKRAGCPAVSHSEEYRQAYAPSYRVILFTLLNIK